MYFTEPVYFIGAGEYNLDDLTEVKAANSYMGLDMKIRQCQNDKTFYNCTTQQYLDSMMAKCGCLPINLRLSNKVPL